MLPNAERRKGVCKKKMRLVATSIVLSLLLVLPALGAETIKIGALYNLTGGMSSIDAPALNGAKLQAKLINKKGGFWAKNWKSSVSTPRPIKRLRPPALKRHWPMTSWPVSATGTPPL
jgi:hypothetical protein